MSVVLARNSANPLDYPWIVTSISHNQIRLLGKRLRDTNPSVPEDYQMLGEVLREYDDALQVVSQGLASLGLEATTRLKTSSTTIDKLRRQPSIDLKHIHDLAGARFVMTMNLIEQDKIVTSICGLWENAQVLDRRESPSFGYRAVHVIVKVNSCFVEIQVRTQYQDTWAQWMERFADRWSRGIRYGEEPEDADSQISPDSHVTRRMLIENWMAVGEEIHKFELGDSAIPLIRSVVPVGTLPELDVLVSEMSVILRDKSFRELNEQFDRLRELLK
jgi:ppGpp synthetase/RelA/SpoT-type nucleotidyltranferase